MNRICEQREQSGSARRLGGADKRQRVSRSLDANRDLNRDRIGVVVIPPIQNSAHTTNPSASHVPQGLQLLKPRS
jgi:hypothetical protein